MHSKIITNPDTLNSMEANETAIEKGLQSQIGKRNAYQLLVNDQRANNNGYCEITYFAMLTHYRLSKILNRKSQVKALSSNQLILLNKQSGKLTLSITFTLQ